MRARGDRLLERAWSDRVTLRYREALEQLQSA